MVHERCVCDCWCTRANGKLQKVKVGYSRKGCVAIISSKHFLSNNYKGNEPSYEMTYHRELHILEYLLTAIFKSIPIDHI